MPHSNSIVGTCILLHHLLFLLTRCTGVVLFLLLLLLFNMLLDTLARTLLVLLDTLVRAILDPSKTRVQANHHINSREKQGHHDSHDTRG